MPRMMSQDIFMTALCYLLLLSGLLEATSLMKIKKAEANLPKGALSIDSAHANNFLSSSRPKRSVDPKWYRSSPDFQSYYRFYNSIGHIEGLYEIDRIRMLYQQMRHLEQVHGTDASSYQNVMGLQTTTTVPPTTTTTTLPPTTLPPTTTTPAPTPDPLADAETLYLCNPKDELCKPSIVYMPTGAVPVLCDPRYNSACRPATPEEMKAEEEAAAAAAAEKELALAAAAAAAAAAATTAPPIPPAPPAPKKSNPPPPPPPVIAKGMEYDCDPYWDPDCLIDHPPRLFLAPVAVEEKPAPASAAPVKEEKKEVVAEAPAAATPEVKKETEPEFDPYDFRRDLFDPFRYMDSTTDDSKE